MHPFERYIYDRLARTLATWPAPISGIDVSDVYLLSLCLDDAHEAEFAYHAGLYVSYNTETRWRSEIASASSPGEARWTLPFWTADYRLVIPGVETYGQPSSWPQTDPTAVALRNAWLTDLGLVMRAGEDSPPYVPEDLDREWQEFAALCARVAHRLHDEGVIYAIFGRPIPILVHDVEFGDSISQHTGAANPPGVLDDYIAWLMDQLMLDDAALESVSWTERDLWRWLALQCRNDRMIRAELRRLDDPLAAAPARSAGLWDRARWAGLGLPAPWDEDAWESLESPDI